MSRLAYTISNQSLTVFVQGRPRSLTKEAVTFEDVRKLLVTPGDHDADHILDLIDVRRALQRASHNAIQFDGSEVIWRGKPLHGLWVDRILDHKEKGEDYTALWAALDKLVHNPTPAAIERLPIFLDRVGLPFMPDGRFLAFKGVKADYYSTYGGNFRHLVGDVCRMPRDQVDANPDNTCSTGLHVGAPGYVRNNYGGGTHTLVLVAVDPVDVVSVPTDYNGEKMRVCGYEVIEHLDQAYTDEIFGRLRQDYLTPKAPIAPAPAARNLAHLAQVGDVVTIQGTGDSIVLEIDNDGPIVTPGQRVANELVVAVKRGGAFVGDIRQELYQEWLAAQGDSDELDTNEDEDEDEDGIDLSPAEQAVVGDLVRVRGSSMMLDGDYTVSAVDEDATCRLCVKQPTGLSVWVANSYVVEILPHTEIDTQVTVTSARLEVEVGDLVEVKQGGWPPAGIYSVAKVDGICITLNTEHDGQVEIDLEDLCEITSRPWTRAVIGGSVQLQYSADIVSEFPGPGWYEVIDLRLNEPRQQIQVRTNHGPWWIDVARVTHTARQA